MARYEHTAGATGRTPQNWPTDSTVALDHFHATLLMFAHPKCPCTRASLEELNRLLTHCQGQVTTHILFFTPEDAATDWTQTGLWQSARAIPGLRVEADLGGRQAARFGAETSGYVVLYDPRGELLFHGGVTAARGHAGDNTGETAIAALLGARQAETERTPVFGCTLQNPERASQFGVEACIKP
ncbi:conserved hypothetical protein [Chthoniobacter flavus Ellin428]|uniref:RedB protein n=1 Tax=Chthoniobacter flavus Ellin428 TaxID=497964 RepID=B4D5V3_9BACT|nr:hypothetical protein [Chthoniobacter flavus]EDY18156.1 conserved hypothetical protein [Chthoniobacter flavus Ellin428]TCO91490.1 hypothetical protein EV701_108218 [Chthoniobacter flavus]